MERKLDCARSNAKMAKMAVAAWTAYGAAT